MIEFFLMDFTPEYYEFFTYTALRDSVLKIMTLFYHKGELSTREDHNVNE